MGTIHRPVDFRWLSTTPTSAFHVVVCLLVVLAVTVSGQQQRLEDLLRGERVISGSEHRSVFKTTYTDETDTRNMRPDQLVREMIKIVIEAEESHNFFGDNATIDPRPLPTRRPRPTTTARPREWLTLNGRQWILFDLMKLPAGFHRRSLRETFSLNFLTSDANSLIWFAGNDRDNMYLTLRDGILYLTVTHNGIEDQTIRITSSNRLDDGQSHNVTISRYDRRINIDVDGSKTIKSISHNADFISATNYIYLGGSEDTSELTQNHVSHNFRGTIKQAYMTGDSYPNDLDLAGLSLVRPSPNYVFINGERDRDLVRPTTTRAPTTARPRESMIFDGQRWILFDLTKLPAGFHHRSVNETFNINFLTNDANSLIWFAGNDRDNMYLTLRNGILYLTVTHNGIEDQTMRITSSRRLDDGRSHNVVISKHDRRIFVDVDGSQTIKYISHDADFVSSTNVIYLGGSEDTSELTHNHVSHNFRGTVNHAIVNGNNYPNDLDLVGLSLIRPSPIYVIINGERDRDHEFVRSTVRPTVPAVVDRDITGVTFTSGQTYLQLPAWDAPTSGSVEFNFKTVQPDGLLLVSSPARGGRSDFFAVELFDGSIYVLFNLGSRTQRFHLGSGVNDGRPHHVKVERNGRTVWMTLDNEQQQEILDATGDGSLDLGTSMYLAGSAFPGSVPWHIVSRRAEFYRGCVWGLSFNGAEPFEIGRLRREQRVPGIEAGCTAMPAECSGAEPACERGQCHERWDGHVCDCSRTTYTGNRCQNDAPLVAFRGSEFVRIQMTPTAVTHTNDISVHFRTSKEDGVLFKTSNTGNSDYMKAAVDRGQIKLETFIESVGRPTTLNVYCDKPVSDNQWHTLYIKRRAGDIEAHIDNCRPAGVQLPGEDYTLNIDEIFIGKSNADEQQRTTFIGNMRNLYFNDHRLFDRFQSGELIDITLSTRRPLPVTRAPPIFPTDKPEGPEGKDDEFVPVQPVTFLPAQNHYVQLSPVPFTPESRVRFMFRTTDRNGLLLFRPGSNYFAVELVNGVLQMVTDTGSGPRFLSDPSVFLSDGQWHEFDLVRSGTDGFIIRIDGKAIGLGLQYPSDSSSAVSEPLYIAGVPVAILNNLPASVSSRKGYTGCLATVHVNGRQFDLQRIATFLKPGCSDVSTVTFCLDNLCQHRGVCLEALNNYLCDCNLTSFAGAHCDEEAEGYLFSEHLKPGILVFTLNPPQYTSRDQIAFGFMTHQLNGTIVRVDSGIVDFIEARVENGYLVFHYDLGNSEQRIVETRRRVNDGQYHYATFVRHGSNVTVHVDDLPVRRRTHDPAAIIFNNLEAVKVGGNLNRENKIIDHFDGIISGVYVNGYRVIDMAIYDHDRRVIVDGDSVIAEHPFRLPIRIPPRPTRKPGEEVVVPPGPDEPVVEPPIEPGDIVIVPPGDGGEAGGGVIGGGDIVDEPIEAPLAAAGVFPAGAEATGTRAAAVAGAMLGVLAAASSLMWAMYKFKPGLIGGGGGGGGTRPMVISSPQTPLLPPNSGSGAGGGGSGGGAGGAGGAGAGSGTGRSVAVMSTGTGASGAGGAGGAGTGRSAYERGYGVITTHDVVTVSSSSSAGGGGAGAAGAGGAAGAVRAVSPTGTMHRGIQTDMADGSAFAVGSGGGAGSSTFVQSTMVKNVYTGQQISGGGAAGYGAGSSPGGGYGAGYSESGGSAAGFGAGSSTAMASYDFASASGQSAAFGSLPPPPLSSETMMTSSSYAYERGVNIVQADGFLPSAGGASSYDATMLSSGSATVGSPGMFQMHNVPLNTAAYGSAAPARPNLMTAAEQIRVDCVQLTTNGRYVVTGSIYGPPQVWDMKTGELVKMMVGEEFSSTDLHLANGDTLLVGQVAEAEEVNAADLSMASSRPPLRKLQIWDFDSGRPLEMRKNESYTSSCMMNDGERMVLSRAERHGGGATVVIWDVLGNEPLRRLTCTNAPIGPADHVSFVGVSRDGRYIVAGYQNSADGQATFVIFDLSEHDVTGPKLLSLPAVVEVTAILDNHEAVTGTSAGELVVWSLRTGKPLRSLVSPSTSSAMGHGSSAKAHLREIKDVAVSKDVGLLVSASADSTLGIWNLDTDKQTTLLRGHRDEVWCCALSNDNELVVSGSRDHTIRLWRVVDGVAVAAIDAGVDIFKVLISNNKKTVVALADKFSTRKLIMLQIVRSKTKSSSSSRSTLPVH